MTLRRIFLILIILTLFALSSAFALIDCITEQGVAGYKVKEDTMCISNDVPPQTMCDYIGGGLVWDAIKEDCVDPANQSELCPKAGDGYIGSDGESYSEYSDCMMDNYTYQYCIQSGDSPEVCKEEHPDAYCQYFNGKESYFSYEINDCTLYADDDFWEDDIFDTDLTDFCSNGVWDRDKGELGIDCGPVCGGECTCPEGYEFNSEFGNCNAIVVEYIEKITRGTISLSKNSVVMNDKDFVTASVQLFTEDEEGNEIPFSATVFFDFSKGINYITDGAKVTNGTGSAKISFLNVEGVDEYDVVISIPRAPNNPSATLKVLSPRPIIKKFYVPKGEVWQDSYNKFVVEVEDPDNDIFWYDVETRGGKLRIYNQDYDVTNATYVFEEETFEFSWFAPALTDKMKLDFLKNIALKAKEQITDFAKSEMENYVDSKLDGFWDAKLGKDGKKFGVSREELGEVFTRIKSGDYSQKDTVLMYMLTRNEQTGPAMEQLAEMQEFYEKGWELGEQINADVGKQAREMGEAYESGEAYWGEYLTRTGLIAISGYELYDGVVGLVGEAVQGKEDNRNYKEKLKDLAKSYTVDVAKEGLQWVATNYKAARAKVVQVPYIMKVTVTDKEGHKDTKAVMAMVSGYETIIE